MSEVSPDAEPGLHILDEVIGFFDERSLGWWLDQGSALGAVRDARFFEWDRDVDISVAAADFEPHRRDFVRLMHESGHRLKSSSYAVQVEAPWGSSGRAVDVRLYSFSSGLGRCSVRHAPPGRTASDLARRAVRVPISLLHRATEWLARRAAGVGSVHDAIAWCSWRLWELRSHLMIRTDFTADAAFFEELSPVTVHGRDMWVPSPAEDYVRYKYGADWRTPKKDWVYWEEDGAIDGR